MVSPDWCLASWRTPHPGGPQEPSLQPFVIPPGPFFESGSLLQPRAFSLLQCIHRLPLAHSTTLEPLRTGPRGLQLPSCNSSILSSIQHVLLATSRTPTRPSRQPAAAQLPPSLFPSPPPPHHRTSIDGTPTGQPPPGRLSIAPAGTNHRRPTDRRTKRPLRRGLGDPFCASRTLCVSRVSYPTVAASPRLSLVPRPIPRLSSVVLPS